MSFIQESNYNSIGAIVIGKSIEPSRNSIIINRGKVDGIKIGYPVISDSGVLVGKIIRVEEKISIVELINDQQSKVAATVMNNERSIGIVEGGYGLSIQMNFIPQNEFIPTGETIVTSGLEKNIPYGLLIGTVEAVEKEAYQPFQRAIISPIINLERIKIVSVLINTEIVL